MKKKEKVENIGEIELMMRIVKSYYELGKTQNQIAQEEFVSRSAICRLLKKAVDKGYVEFTIKYPACSVNALEAELKNRFNIESAFVTSIFSPEYPIRLKSVCDSAAKEVAKIIRDYDIISMNWGVTIDQFCESFVPEQPRRNLSVVMINGTFAGTAKMVKCGGAIHSLSTKLDADGYIMPAPLLVDSEEIANSFKHDSHIRFILDLAKKSDVSVLSLGSISKNSLLINRGSFSDYEYEEIIVSGAVGDIAGRFFDINGQEINSEIVRRTMAITINDIKKKKNRIVIAVGKNKAMALLGALNGGLVTKLFTDEETALKVISLSNMLRKSDRGKFSY